MKQSVLSLRRVLRVCLLLGGILFVLSSWGESSSYSA
jgi:hypothetical protein